MHNKTRQTWPTFAANRIGLGLTATLIALLALGAWVGETKVSAARGEPIGLSQFQQLWDRSDKAVAEGRTKRSWTWGPTLGPVETEPYTQGSTRKVQYFDKTRMEQTESRGVSNGLLAKELITGSMQMGDQDFKQYPPDTLHNIAGDQVGNVPNPTYASFRKVSTIDVARNENKAGDQTGQTLTATLDRDGKVGANPSLGPTYNVKNAYFEKTLAHNIPGVFWDFMNGSGLIYRDGQFVQDRVFDWAVGVGLPLSEAYWTRSVFGGKTLDILVQVFERRVLTFTPANEPGFRVEMGNVGQNYRDWRNAVLNDSPRPTQPAPVPTQPTVKPVPSQPVPTQPVPNPAPTQPAPGPTEPVTPLPGPGPTPPQPTPGPIGNLGPVPDWNAPTRLGPISPQIQQIWRSSVAVNPKTGGVYVLGDSGSGTASYQGKALLLTTTSQPGQYYNIEDAPADVQGNDKYAHMTFAADGTGYIAWRYVPSPNWRAWLRQVKPDGTFLPGVDIGQTYKNSGGGDTLDEPDIAYSDTKGKLYITGLIGVNPNGRWWGFAESGDGGKSWSNFMTLGANKPGDARDLFPHICVDKNDNVHVAAFWGSTGSVVVRSRINGVWQSNFQTLVTPASAGGWYFRDRLTIACGADGYAYVAWDAPNSVGIGRYTPGQGWAVANTDAFPGQTKAFFDLTTSPDGRVWLAAGRGTFVNGTDNVTVLVSPDRGQNFGSERTAIAHTSQVAGVSLRFSTVTNRLYLTATFKEPGPRESYVVSTK